MRLGRASGTISWQGEQGQDKSQHKFPGTYVIE